MAVAAAPLPPPPAIVTAGVNAYAFPPPVTAIALTAPPLIVAVAVAVVAGLAISPGLLLTAVMVKFSDWPGPAVMPVRPTVWGVLVFSRMGAGFAIGLIVGAWLTGLTVTVKICEKVLMPPLAVPPLSTTVTVIVAVPLWLGST